MMSAGSVSFGLTDLAEGLDWGIAAEGESADDGSEAPEPLGSECIGEAEDGEEDEEPSPKGGIGDAFGGDFGASPSGAPNLVDSPRMVRTYSSLTIRLEYQIGPAWVPT